MRRVQAWISVACSQVRKQNTGSAPACGPGLDSKAQ